MTAFIPQRRNVCAAWAILACAIAASGCVSTEPRDHPALWHAEADGHDLWLFGSLHRLPAGFNSTAPSERWTQPVSGSILYRKHPVSSRLRSVLPSTNWFHGPLRTAFRHSPVIMLETSDTLTRRELFALAAGAEQRGDCKPVSQYLTAQTKRELQGLTRAPQGDLDNDSAAVPETAAAALFTITTLDSAQASQSLVTGVDAWISAQARASGKQIVPLETAEDRLTAMQRAFAKVPCLKRAQLLESFVVGRAGAQPVTREDFHELVDRWRIGDMQALASQIERFRTGSDIMFEAFTGGRNRIWLPRILEQLERNYSVLVVVGSAHLAGPENLLQLIENQGIPVERVQ